MSFRNIPQQQKYKEVKDAFGNLSPSRGIEKLLIVHKIQPAKKMQALRSSSYLDSAALQLKLNQVTPR
jgi:hypothetical protein